MCIIQVHVTGLYDMTETLSNTLCWVLQNMNKPEKLNTGIN
jgi:hypothetical protein